MPKCGVCGKNFKSIAALNDHHRATHPHERLTVKKKGRTGLVVGLLIVIVLVGGFVGYLMMQQQQAATGGGRETGLLGKEISIDLYQRLTDVSFSTLSSVGFGDSVTAPKPVAGNPLTSDGKPQILYMGGEYCPYCASERWSMVVALSKFGNFSKIRYMLSAPNEGNISTVTFYGSTYTSLYISFVAVEMQDRAHNPLQNPTPAQQGIQNQYDPDGSIPFIDIANRYVVVGAQFPINTFTRLSWTQIAVQLDNPRSAVAKNVNAAANTLITAICKVDGGQPVNVCSQSFAKLSFTSGVFYSGPPLIANPTIIGSVAPKESSILRLAKPLF